ncbi:hypothetical protein EHH44_18730 [Mycolicibacter terrae]|uniref:Lipoprotein n=2 Tax=Mycolicibacter TaxID=1073531 RepID=A0A1A2NHT3_MYCSD|nr:MULTISPECIES: hypothetical protein [Mycolicibacter]OBH14643.1 hypothetical protein A5694_12140 [Mycolicibacter sinensis]OBI32051.1 hypothetical protein A5710_16360 [Mycolicibacter sinensis]RRR41674.1 hypothetical protein EHH44_18730 [Mycolicibacter terrae]
MRTLIAALLALAVAAATACSGPGTPGPYGAQGARIGEALTLLGWEMTLTNLRWEVDHVLIDVKGRLADGDAPHAAATELRFGIYGTPAHPVEATGLGSCDVLGQLTPAPLSDRDPERLDGTVCLGPLKERSAVRGIYAYSPADRIKDTTVAYAAAFPVGLPPVNPYDTGLALTVQGVAAYRTDGVPLAPAALGDPKAFSGNGYMVLSLTADALAGQYRDDAEARGGPLMLIAGPATPMSGLGPDCLAYGSSVLILPEASLKAVHVPTSLCTHGEINAALLYASVSVVGTHAAVWTTS